MKWAFSDPERLRPGETRQSLTERVAASFASVAQALRDRGHDPQAVAHFVNRLVVCMFADDVGLLPDHMFTRMLRHALPAPARFGELAGELFRAMASGGRVGFETDLVQRQPFQRHHTATREDGHPDGVGGLLRRSR